MKLPLSFIVIYSQIATAPIILIPTPRTPMDSTPSASLPLSFSGGGGDMDVGDAPEPAGTRAPVD
jgi:hypothetical protein